MISDLIARVKTHREGKDQKVAHDYDELVRHLATGSTHVHTVAETAKLLEIAGKNEDQLQADVDLMRRRQELATATEQLPAAEKRDEEATANVALLRSEREQAILRYDARIREAVVASNLASFEKKRLSELLTELRRTAPREARDALASVGVDLAVLEQERGALTADLGQPGEGGVLGTIAILEQQIAEADITGTLSNTSQAYVSNARTRLHDLRPRAETMTQRIAELDAQIAVIKKQREDAFAIAERV